MNACVEEHRGQGFVRGLLAGTAVGAGLAMWLVPRMVAELRRRRDVVADRVVRGAREVERYAAATRSDS